MNTTTKACKSHTGTIVHAAVEVPNTIGNGGQRFTANFALCGKQPGSRTLTVGYLETYRPINCPSCLQKLAGQHVHEKVMA